MSRLHPMRLYMDALWLEMTTDGSIVGGDIDPILPITPASSEYLSIAHDLLGGADRDELWESIKKGEYK